MKHPIARLVLWLAMLAAGHAGVSPAHELAKVWTCGGFPDPGPPVGVVIEKGTPTWATAKKAVRSHLRSHARCGGSACEHTHFGSTCASAKAPDRPRLAGCTKAKSRVGLRSCRLSSHLCRGADAE